MAVLPTYLLLTYPQPFEKPSIMIQAIYEMVVNDLLIWIIVFLAQVLMPISLSH